MVQILNKMVHLKYPILEICWCHKHTTRLPPLRLKFDTKLRKVFPIWQHSSAQVILAGKILHPISVCSSQSNASIKTQIFCFVWHLLLFSNAFFKAEMWQKLRNMSPSRFVSTALHKSLLQAKYMSIACKFWVFVLAKQMHALKSKSLGTLWPLFCF